MCGVVGVVLEEPANQCLFDALTMLQHRGQDAAGMVTADTHQLHSHKKNGLVREVFHTRHMQQLIGTMGIGHIRYPTAGSQSEVEAQPFYVNSPYGIALAHNGNLTNAFELRDELFRQDLRHLNTHSDSEVILNIFAHELQKKHHLAPTPDDIFDAVRAVHQRCRGAYAVVALVFGVGLVAFRDPNGIRPLILGTRQAKSHIEYMVASESVALTAAEFAIDSDVAPGEAILIDKDHNIHRQLCAKNTQLTPCIFEYVYLARPDSIIDKVSVYEMRLACGERLGDAIAADQEASDIDVVIPIPETSRSSALSLAQRINVPFREGFVKNRYVGRTFIMPGQKIRRKSVRQKLNPNVKEFAGKVVLLVDDSIVRGTTSKEIIQMARDSGAKKVYFASASPAIRYPNIYGIDTPSPQELVGFERTTEEVAQCIGADKLFYLELSDLIESGKLLNPDVQRFETSVFDGQYVTGSEEQYLQTVSDRHRD